MDKKKKIPNSENNLDKEKPSRCNTLLDFQIYSTAIVFQAVW